MRIRIPRRFLLLGILLCSLALVASVPQSAFAKPIPWSPEDGPAPGDGDGPVVKGTGAGAPKSTAIAPSVTAMRNTKAVTTVSSMWKAYLTALRLGYGWRWIW
jgi:hypothetical protein